MHGRREPRGAVAGAVQGGRAAPQTPHHGEGDGLAGAVVLIGLRGDHPACRGHAGRIGGDTGEVDGREPASGPGVALPTKNQRRGHGDDEPRGVPRTARPCPRRC